MIQALQHPALIQRPVPHFHEGAGAASTVGAVALAALGAFVSFVFLPWQAALATSGVLTALLAMLCCTKEQDPNVIVVAQPNQDRWYHRVGHFFRGVDLHPVVQPGVRVPVGGVAPVAAVPVFAAPPVAHAPLFVAPVVAQPPQQWFPPAPMQPAAPPAAHLGHAPQARVPVGHGHHHAAPAAPVRAPAPHFAPLAVPAVHHAPPAQPPGGPAPLGAARVPVGHGHR